MIRRHCARPPWRHLIPALAALLLFSALAAGCHPRPEEPVTAQNALYRVEPGDVPLFTDDMDRETLVRAVRHSLEYYTRVGPERRFTYGPDTYTAAELIHGMSMFLDLLSGAPSAEALNGALRDLFAVYRSPGRDGAGTMLFTGYYEPVLRGSHVPTDEFRWPLYGMPDDMVRIELFRFSDEWEGKTLLGRVRGNTVLPYFTRKEIDSGNRLSGRGLEIAWCDDPVDVFFLHIQGSGQVVFPDGESIHAHYAGQNGRPYRSVGRLLIDEGLVPREEMSMQAIRAYLEAHPDDMERVMNHNESYVFFTVEEEGPLGCLNVPLTPGRSVATDRRLFPEGGLAWIASEKPVTGPEGEITQWEEFGRFVMNQDTGGAIKGTGRLDVFWGQGDYAVLAAGHMKHPGALYFLAPKKPGD